MSLILSDRQYPMLHAFIDQGQSYVMSIEQAQAFDQRPFRSMLVRKYVEYRIGRKDESGRFRKGGFVLTRKGRDAFFHFHETSIARKHPELPLTRYFDPTAYGLAIPEKPAPRKREHRVAGAA